MLLRAEWDVARYPRSGLGCRCCRIFRRRLRILTPFYPQRHHQPARVREFVGFVAKAFIALNPARPRPASATS
jgi:hypothetical protein